MSTEKPAVQAWDLDTSSLTETLVKARQLLPSLSDYTEHLYNKSSQRGFTHSASLLIYSQLKLTNGASKTHRIFFFLGSFEFGEITTA